MNFAPRISLLAYISEVILQSLNCFLHKRVDELFSEVNKVPRTAFEAGKDENKQNGMKSRCPLRSVRLFSVSSHEKKKKVVCSCLK